jgi:DNA-directed RNA polymerase subunit omega
MMLYPTMPQLLEKVNSRYLLVNVVANRARQISAEAEEEGIQLEKKPVTIAIEEVAEGKITAYVDDHDNVSETVNIDTEHLSEDEVQ